MKGNPGSFRLAGMRVCSRAFQKITGISAGTLQNVRDQISKGVVNLYRNDTLAWMSIRNQAKAHRYLDARCWIETYAEVHGEKSPMRLQIFLPAGRKFFYHSQYEFERCQELCRRSGDDWWGEDEFCITTTLENASHGASSQATMLTRQLHRTALKEGKLPSCLYIGADNTPKETKNGTVISWAIWLLSCLRETNLTAIEFQYPLVGHTHGSLDRFFSRLITCLKGRTYYTMTEMAEISCASLKAFNMNWSHHGSTYDFSQLRRVYGIEVHRYRNVHCLRLYVDSTGLWAMWKQYVSDESWSRPRLLVEIQKLPILATARPPLVEHQFEETEKAKYFNFLNKLEPGQCLMLRIRMSLTVLSDDLLILVIAVVYIGFPKTLSKETTLAASGRYPQEQLRTLRSYLEGLDPGPTLEAWLILVMYDWLN
eukprot:s434_g4.t1